MRLVPLISRGPPGVSRPLGAPSVVSAIPSNPVVWFEDFYATAVAKKLYEVGTVATPDTTTHVSAVGSPSWIITEAAGTTGLAGCTAGSGGTGVLSLTTGTTSGNTIIGESGGRSGSSVDNGGTINVTTATAGRFNVVIRFLTGAAITNCNFGIGLPLSSLNFGTDWITDPDTTLAGATTTGNSIVLSRHVASYSGDTAGNMILRLYEATGTDDTSLDLTALTGVAVATNTAYKLELSFTSGAITAYLNGVLAGTISTPSILTWTGRPSFIVQTSTAAARTLNVDSYYQEVGQATAR